MTRIMGILLVVWLPVLSTSVGAAQDESPAAYEIVSATAVTVLPTPLRGFFETRLDALQQSATARPIQTDRLEARSHIDAAGANADWHYVMLDCVTDGDVRRFPQDRAEAMQLFKRRGVRDGGQLPWVTLDRYKALVRAFTSGKGDVLTHEAGTLLHSVTDAVLPFNTTRHRDGKRADALHWPQAEADAGSARHRTVRHRCQIDLLNRFRERFDFEVRVFPERHEDIVDPRQAVFDALFDSHDAVDELMEIDAEVLADLDIQDSATFLASADAYYQQLMDRAAPVMETRLEAGALLGAGLIAAAWAEAGKPVVHSTPAASSVVRGDASSQEPAGSPYVGSRHSKIFHKAACPHAQRIKPENLIGFDSVKDAVRAGRTPCKTCQPTAP